MRLVQIPHKDVDPESGVTHNSNFHTEVEAPHLTVSTEGPSHYKRWLPLIAASQGIAQDDIQTVTLTSPQSKILSAAATIYTHARRPSLIHQEELEEDVAPAFAGLVFPPTGLFVRLDPCSPKDGIGGTTALKTVSDIVKRLSTSGRASSAIDRFLGAGLAVTLYFLPHDADMRTMNEYRVFCPPPTGGIAAVSQYKWHALSALRNLSAEDLDATVKSIMVEIRRIHSDIMALEPEDEQTLLMLKQGFTFDVKYDGGTGACVLIELNSFGSRSGCGSCLFHWLRDEEVLYGRAEPEFRLAV